MLTDPISASTNGVRGGHPRRGHRRSHASHTSISYSGYPTPLDINSTTVTEEEPPEFGNAQQPAPIPPNGSMSGFGDTKAFQGHGHSVNTVPVTYSAMVNKGHDDGLHEHDLDSGHFTDRLLSRETLYSILVPVPYAMVQFLMRWKDVQPESPHVSADDTVGEIHVQDTAPKGHAFLLSCSLVSVTLVLLGFLSISQKQWFRTEAGKTVPGLLSSHLGTTKLQSAVVTALSIGLPFYSALQLDSGRTATAMMIVYGSGSSPFLQLSSQGGIYKQLMPLLNSQKAAIGCLSVMLLLDGANFTSSIELSQTLRGYLALLLSTFVIQPPLRRGAKTGLSDGEISSGSSGATSTEASNASDSDIRSLKTGAALGCTTFIVALITGVLQTSFSGLLAVVLIGLCSAVVFGINPPILPRGPSHITVAAGLSFSFVLAIATSKAGYWGILAHALFSGLAFASIHLGSTFDSASHSHHHHKDEKQVSRLTKFLLARFKGWPFIYGILKEKDSRRIFYFMSLNFGFMLVQMAYGIITGSLGLLSDSVHMLFDCFALLVGLCAAVMSKWPPSARFPYGYGKVDTLAGFANGVFLMIISVEIVYEAIERLMSGSEMQRLGELLVVSTAGLAVNMVGIMAFDHGHHHGHGHSHSHGGHDHDSSDPHPHHTNENMHGIFLHILADTLGSVAVVISTILVHFYGWPGFDPIASCMIAILIFVSAIPLVTSTSKTLLLALPADVEYNLRDTLAGVSALRGVVGYTVPKFWLDDTVHDHQHKHKHDHDHHHGHAHGCSGHSHSHSHDHHHDHSPSHSHNRDHDHTHSHSHTHSHDHHGHDHGHDHHHNHAAEGQRVLGVMHVIASRTADLEDVRRRTINYLREKDMDILIQVEREGEGKCWCGGGNKAVS